MPEITWRNVNSIANSDGVQQAIGNLQHSLTALGNVGTKYIDRRMAIEDEYRRNLKQDNTDAIINQMQQVQDMQQLAQAKATGVYDLGALQHLSGGMIDGKQFNTAYGSWDKNTLDKVQTADTALDYDPETKAKMAEYYQAISQGDTAKAAELFKTINASKGTMYSLAKDQYGILKDEREYNSKSLEEGFKIQEQWIKAKQDEQTALEQLKQFELKADEGYQGALAVNSNLTKEEYLAGLPEYQELLKKHTASKAIYDSIDKTYSTYREGRALGTTAGSPYNSQSERALGGTADEGIPPSGYTVVKGLDMKQNRPTRNNNAFNMMPDKFSSEVGANKTDGRFVVFDSPIQAWAAMTRKMNGGWMKEHTINSFPTKYLGVGGADGHTEEEARNYAQVVAKVSGVDPNKKIGDMTPEEQYKVMQGIAKIEGYKGKIPSFDEIKNYKYGKKAANSSTGSNTESKTNAQTAKDIVKEATAPTTATATQVVDNATKAAQSKPTEPTKTNNFTEESFINEDGSVNIEGLKEAAKNRAGELINEELQRMGATSSNPYSTQSIEKDRIFNKILDDLVSDKPTDQWSAATKEFIKGFPALDPSNPNSKSTYRALVEGLKEYANTNDAVKIEQEQKMLQHIIGADKVGGITREDLTIPKSIKISTKNGSITETEETLKQRFFDKTGKKLKSEEEFNKATDALFAQTGFWDQKTVRDNIRKAIEATGSPMLVLKTYQDAMLQTYRHEKGKPNATLQEMVNSNYVPDMDFNSFSGTDFGKQFLQKIDAMAGFNESTLKTLNNEFKLIDERHANINSGAAKIAYVKSALQTADKNNVVRFNDSRKWMQETGVIRRYSYNESENKARNEVGKHAREIIKSLPASVQSTIDKMNKYGNLDDREIAFMRESAKTNDVTITPEQYKDIIDITNNNANHPEVQKLIAFMEGYGGKLKISNKK